MVDLDEKVVEVSKQFLPEFHQNSFEDKRSELIIGDAVKYLREYTVNQTHPKFDVVILDFVDLDADINLKQQSTPTTGNDSTKNPAPPEDGTHLYSTDLYEMIKGKMKSGGVLVTQSGSCESNQYTDHFYPVFKRLHTVFKGNVYPYCVAIPSFGGLYSFILSINLDSEFHSPLSAPLESVPRFPTPEIDLNSFLKEKMGSKSSLLKFLNTTESYQNIHSNIPYTVAHNILEIINGKNSSSWLSFLGF